MRIIADLQLHSKYSRAVSQKMILPEIAKWAMIKRIDLMATGDWTHPLWYREISSQLVEKTPGLYGLKESSKPLFLLSGEISSIYTQGGKQRRIHNLIFAPSLTTVDKINKTLTKRGANLMSDGRPIVGLTSIEIADIVFSIDPKCLLIPAHAYTPWFSLYGSKSGFDSIEECFGSFAPNIYAVETGLSCYDEETEILTDDGWKKFTEIEYSNKVCTLNVETGKVEYQRPTKIHSYQYKGRMYRLKTKRVDLLVTPNHKVLYSPCDFRKKPKFYLKEAEFLFNKSKRFKKDGVWLGRNDKYFILPTVQVKHGSRYYSGHRHEKEKRLPIKSWLRFFGFWIAEGWTSKGKDGSYAVCIANQNNKLLLEMKKILESFGYNVYWDKKVNNTLRVRDYQLFHYLKQFGKSSDKFIPQEIKSLSKELLEIFFEYYIKGDGHKYGRTNKGLSATTISVRLRDDLQEIALKMGISAYYKLGSRKGTPILSLPKARAKGYKQSKDAWIIYFVRKNLHTVLPSTIKKFNYIENWVNFKGQVYCVTVPNHVVYVRRNGIPVWCGNSDPAMNWRIKELDDRSIISCSDAHSGPKLGREATVFEIQKQEASHACRQAGSKKQEEQFEFSYQDIADAIKQNPKGRSKIAFTIEFYPEEGKYHYTGHRLCNVKQNPAETLKLGTICPVCKKPLTVGVMHRVDELAKRSVEELKIVRKGMYITTQLFPQRPPYVMIVPLLEIIAEALGSPVTSLRVTEVYLKLTQSLGGEFTVLLKSTFEEIAKAGNIKIAEGVRLVREGNIKIEPGFDGVFGRVKIWNNKEGKEENNLDQEKQLDLFS